MTDKKTEALKLALECIEAWDRGANASDYWRDRFDAITAIREALADSALDRMADNARELGLDYEPPCKTGSQCTSKCQQCEQPAQQQEPVAWITQNGKGWLRWHKPEDNNTDSVPLYTSPPASKPLTDEQIMEMYNEPRSDAEMLEFARAIEAAHGIKGDA